MSTRLLTENNKIGWLLLVRSTIINLKVKGGDKMEKESKKVFQKWWFWLILILVIIIILLIFLLLKKDNEGIGTAGISKKEFEEIRTGMSQFEVNSIIDKLDEWDNDEIYKNSCEEIEKSTENHIYKYYGENGGYAIITYTADYSKGDLFVLPQVTKKEQFGLK